jgi:hypothetical protein
MHNVIKNAEERQGERREGLRRTVIGCMAIFRLPMFECKLRVNEGKAYAR